MLNYSQAHISTTIAASVPRGRGRKAPKFEDFMFDFEKAIMSDQEKLDDKIRKMFSKQKV
jgi:hypothetical protein